MGPVGPILPVGPVGPVKPVAPDKSVWKIKVPLELFTYNFALLTSSTLDVINTKDPVGTLDTSAFIAAMLLYVL